MGRSVKLNFPQLEANPKLQASNLRKLSISFSHETIWFEVGMLCDATISDSGLLTV
jgi:hypothetical protein